MKRFRLFLLAFAAIAVIAGVLAYNITPRIDSFSSFTPPGRIVLASFPLSNSTELRGSEPTSVSSTVDATATPAMPAVAQKKNPATTPATTPAPAPALAPKNITQPNEPSTPKPSVTTCSGAFSQEFMCLLNQYRVSKGLGKLSYNSGLAAVALKHSQWMNSTGIFSHEESDGSHLLTRCQAAGIICRGENLAKGATSAQNLLDMWVASPSHNTNLIGSYTTMGLGISGSYITLLLN